MHCSHQSRGLVGCAIDCNVSIYSDDVIATWEFSADMKRNARCRATQLADGVTGACLRLNPLEALSAVAGGYCSACKRYCMSVRLLLIGNVQTLINCKCCVLFQIKFG